MSSIHPLHPELIWAFTIDEQQIGPIHEARDIKVETNLNAEEKLTFQMLPNDPKLPWIGADRYVEYRSQAWRIGNRKSVRSNAEHLVEWEAYPLWYDLVDEVKFGDFIITNLTMTGGLAQILAGTTWTSAFMSDPGTVYSMEAKNGSVLELIRAWASITGYEIRWNTTTREVGFVDALGEDSQVSFRYGRNLDSVTQLFEPPQATRLYPQGAQDVDITNVNGGIPYIENFDWYTDQGLTELQARDLYLKEAIWQDDSFIQPLTLLDSAVLRLAELSQPTISYECTVLDLSELTNQPGDSFTIGDVVWVHDETLDISIRTRVVRIVEEPYHHWDNEVELSYLRPGFTTNLVDSFGSSTGGSSEWRLLVDENNGSNIAGSAVVICAITFTTSGNTSGIIGGHVVGTATNTGTVEFTVTMDSNVIGGTISRPFTNGQVIDVGIPSWTAGVAEGTHTLELRGRISSGAGSVTVPEFSGRLYLMANNTLGGGAGGFITSMVVADTLWGDVFTPSGDSATFLSMTDITAGPSDTLADSTVDPAEAGITIDIV